MGRGNSKVEQKLLGQSLPTRSDSRCWQEQDFERPVVYYRETGYEKELAIEFEALQNNFSITTDLEQIRPKDLVVSRFTQLPFTELLFEEINHKRGFSFNSLAQVSYIEDARCWSRDLEGLTPRSWFSLGDATRNHSGPFFIKGITNSRKDDWEKFSFAKDLRELNEVVFNLSEDPLISQQNLFFREYVPLRYDHRNPETAHPLAEEYRVFVCDNQILSKGIYIADPENSKLLPEGLDPDSIPEDFLQETIGRIGNKANYYALDVARTESGDWTVIELNDASQTGLAGNDPETLYGNLSDVINKYKS